MLRPRCQRCLTDMPRAARPAADGEYYCKLPACVEFQKQMVQRHQLAQKLIAEHPDEIRCRGCGDEVFPRKPSATGDYYCKKVMCRNDYQKRYQRARKEEARRTDVVRL